MGGGSRRLEGALVEGHFKCGVQGARTGGTGFLCGSGCASQPRATAPEGDEPRLTRGWLLDVQVLVNESAVETLLAVAEQEQERRAAAGASSGRGRPDTELQVIAVKERKKDLRPSPGVR